jgi:hypothetical protein
MGTYPLADVRYRRHAISQMQLSHATHRHYHRPRRHLTHTPNTQTKYHTPTIFLCSETLFRQRYRKEEEKRRRVCQKVKNVAVGNTKWDLTWVRLFHDDASKRGIDYATSSDLLIRENGSRRDLIWQILMLSRHCI